MAAIKILPSSEKQCMNNFKMAMMTVKTLKRTKLKS